MGVPTPTPTPCLLPSPACTAVVCAPRCGRFCAEDLVVMMQPFCARSSPAAKHQFGAARLAALGVGDGRTVYGVQSPADAHSGNPRRRSWISYHNGDGSTRCGSCSVY